MLFLWHQNQKQRESERERKKKKKKYATKNNLPQLSYVTYPRHGAVYTAAKVCYSDFTNTKTDPRARISNILSTQLFVTKTKRKHACGIGGLETRRLYEYTLQWQTFRLTCLKRMSKKSWRRFGHAKSWCSAISRISVSSQNLRTSRMLMETFRKIWIFHAKAF